MAMSDVVKGLLKQTGVSVLAGLLMSSAVMAEDAASDAGNVSGGAEMSVDAAEGDVDGGEGVDADAAEDAGFDVVDVSPVGGEYPTVEEGEVPEISECGFGFEVPDVSLVYPIEGEWNVTECTDCEGVPDVSPELLGTNEVFPVEALPLAIASDSDAAAVAHAAPSRRGEGAERSPLWWLLRGKTN